MTGKMGFTLAELLIALALLGIIAAFTIPKVLQSNAEAERVALLRETVATLENAWYNARATNTVVSGTLHANLQDRINAVRISNFVAFAPGELMHGTVPHPCLDPFFTLSGASYFQLHNGVVITNTGGYGYSPGEIMGPPVTGVNLPLCIDLNGPAGPNQLGQDAFIATFNPWGDFDGGLPVYLPRDNQRSFLWGSVSEPPRDSVGLLPGPPYDDPNAWVGTWLTR